ncbi:MAG: hypothetical protein NVSMB9_19310 [Isosphaeraceae bacterium]
MNDRARPLGDVSTREDRERFDDWVDKQRQGGATDLIRREISLDEKSSARRHNPGTEKTQLQRVGGYTMAFEVDMTWGGVDL